MEEDELVTNLRAIIISSKGGLPLNHVKGDYRDTFGGEIPLRKFGYSSLEEFFKRKSEDFKLYSNRVEAIPKSSSLHISSLVSEQNDGKRRARPKAGSKRQRRPLHSGTHSMYRPLMSNHSFPKKSYDGAPRFRKQIDIKQSSSIDRAKSDSDRSSVKSDKEEPESKFCKRDDGATVPDVVKCAESKAARSRAEKNLFLAKTLEKQGVAPKQTTADDDRKIKNESQDVFRSSPSKDDIPFDSFEECYAFAPRSRPQTEDDIPFEPFEETFVTGVRSRPSRILRDSNRSDSRSETRSSSGSGTPLPAVSPTLSTTLFSDFEENPPKPLKKSAQSRLERIKSSVRATEETFDVYLEREETLEAKSPGEKARVWTIRLKDLCLSHGYSEPIYEVTSAGPDLFFSRVVVGDKFKLSSFPVEQPDEESAREFAAKKAHRHISAELNSVKRKPSEAELTVRICELISTSYGIWSDKLPDLYFERYKEAIDESWFAVVHNSSKFEISQPLNDARFIVHIKNTSGETEEENETEEVERKNVITTPLVEPAPVFWEVYVLSVKNSSQVWCRLIGEDYSDKYDALMTELELDPPKTRVKTPIVDEIYARSETGVEWHRVKLLSTKDDGNEGTIFCVDTGEVEDVELSELYYLDPHHLDLPAQAIHISLHELDCFAEDGNLTALLESKLLSQIFIAEIVHRERCSETGARSAVFWDTSTEEDINVNKSILDEIAAEIPPLRLEKNNQLKEAFISEITDDGDIFIVTNKEAIRRIDAMILFLIATKCDKSTVCSPETVNLQELYLTRCEKTGNYSRAKVLRKIDPDRVDVLFVDSGIAQRSDIGDVYPLSKLSPCLAKIPPQTLKVRLANLEFRVWNSSVARKLRDTMPQDEVVLVKRIEAKDDVLYVEIFRRSTQDNSLSPVSIALTKHDSSKPTENRSRKKSEAIGQESVLYDNLSPPPVPGVGNYYDVYVTLAASPDLFTIQPLRSLDDLADMQNRLQEICKKFETLVSREAEDRVVGNLYAVLHSDDNWYRGVLQAALGSSMFSIYLCDYGEFVVAPSERLVPLPDKPEVFKSLPYQALRARLYGVVPSNKDWSAEDCVYFQKLVVDKVFVSTVKEIKRDPNNVNNITLGLILTDTSGQDDIHIHKLLIDNKSAIPARRES